MCGSELRRNGQTAIEIRGETKAMPTAVAGKGLEGIVAANSGICWIDGDAGILSYRGIDIHELAEHSTFEETHLPAVERNAAQRSWRCASSSRNWRWRGRSISA